MILKTKGLLNLILKTKELVELILKTLDLGSGASVYGSGSEMRKAQPGGCAFPVSLYKFRIAKPKEFECIFRGLYSHWNQELEKLTS